VTGLIDRLAPRGRPPALLRYGAALAAALGALVIRAALAPVLGANAPLLVFVLAVTVSAWYGGLWPGLVTTLASVAIGAYFFVPPIGQLLPESGAEWLRVTIFATEGVIISVLTESLRRQTLRVTSQTAALAASEDRFRLLVEGLQDYAVYILDPDGRIMTWNAGAQRIIGATGEQIIGQSAAVLYPVQEGAALGPFLTRVAEQGHEVEEGLRRRRDGSLFWAHVLTTALRTPAGALYGYAQITRDISERKEAEAALRSSAELFRATFEQAAVGIAHVGVDGRWLRVNQRLCDIVGYPRDELLARSFQAITHPDDLASDLALMRQVLAGSRTRYTIDKRYIRSDGSAIWIALTVSLVRDADGRPDYFISVVEDISARVAAETALRELNVTLEQRVSERTAQLEAANDELEAFAYVAAHDLRAPLRALQGFASALQEDYADALDPLGRRYASRIDDAARQMDVLVQDLLTYSQLSRVDLPRQPVSLRHVVADACDQLSGRIAEVDAAVQTQDTALVAFGHYSALVQVVTNLMANALTFVPPNTRPRVRVWAEPVDCEGGVRCARLWVEDNGIGIAPEHHERIFRAFERLHGMEAYPGTGIGLAIVRKAVERIGGRVGVESEVGSGSRFWVLLPLAEERA
jgi:PAS domain S-box-containing protein